jgi:hypothetical protein
MAPSSLDCLVEIRAVEQPALPHRLRRPARRRNSSDPGERYYLFDRKLDMTWMFGVALAAIRAAGAAW